MLTLTEMGPVCEPPCRPRDTSLLGAGAGVGPHDALSCGGRRRRFGRRFRRRRFRRRLRRRFRGGLRRLDDDDLDDDDLDDEDPTTTGWRRRTTTIWTTTTTTDEDEDEEDDEEELEDEFRRRLNGIPPAVLQATFSVTVPDSLYSGLPRHTPCKSLPHRSRRPPT